MSARRRFDQLAQGYACSRCAGTGIEPATPPTDPPSTEHREALYRLLDEIAANQVAAEATLAGHYGSTIGEPDAGP